MSKSDPKVRAFFEAGGIRSPAVPTKGSMTRLPSYTSAWLHIRKAKSLSADVGPKYIRLDNWYFWLNLAVAILFVQSSIPKYTCLKV